MSVYSITYLMNIISTVSSPTSNDARLLHLKSTLVVSTISSPHRLMSVYTIPNLQLVSVSYPSSHRGTPNSIPYLELLSVLFPLPHRMTPIYTVPNLLSAFVPYPHLHRTISCRVINHGNLSSSFKGSPLLILATFSAEWKSSASKKRKPSFSASKEPTEVFPQPATPNKMIISGIVAVIFSVDHTKFIHGLTACNHV